MGADRLGWVQQGLDATQIGPGAETGEDRPGRLELESSGLLIPEGAARKRDEDGESSHGVGSFDLTPPACCLP